MKINILLPFPSRKPAGGTRVMYEYANQLAQLKHKVVFYHPVSVPDVNSATHHLFKMIYYSIFRPPVWFKLNKKIKSTVIPYVSNKYIKDADIIFFTWWSLAYEVQKLSTSKGIKYNLVQDIEIWNGKEDKVYASYGLPDIHHIVISEHIKRFIENYSLHRVKKVLLAIDDKKYRITVSPALRRNETVCMMYSEEPRKGSMFGMEAIIKAKEKLPGLKVTLFSVYHQPENLPEFVQYVFNPPNIENIYNNSAIFIGPSVQEGCALPPMEAMRCGCAVICTDIEGHGEYARNNETCILVPVRNPDAMADAIVSLALDAPLRIQIAEGGHRFIANNTWKKTATQLEKIWEEAMQAK